MCWPLLNTIHVGTLTLEPQLASHAAEMFVVLSDPAIYQFENAPPASLEWLTQRFTKLASRRSGDGNEQWLNWVVRLPSGELTGYVQATVTNQGFAYVAYEFASQYWRRGIGSASVGAVLDELAANYAVRTVIAVLKARNFRSVALLQHLGFTDALPAGLSHIKCEPDERLMARPIDRGE